MSPLYRSLRVAVSTIAVVVMLCSGVAFAAPVPIKACLSTALSSSTFGIAFAAKYWTYSNLAITPKYIGSPDGSARGVTLSMAANGTDCDVYFGPLTSQMTQAVNALVNCVWMASTVTSTEFNDRTNYPYFSRVMPAADVIQGGIASVMIANKWTTVSVLCTDNAYGQAAAAGLGQYLRAAGGQSTAQCVSVSADYSTVEKVVLQAMASTSRVLYIASLSTEAAFIQGRLAVLNNNASSKMIIIFSELALGTNWVDVPGAITAYFGFDASLYDFLSAAALRDTTDERAQIASLGLKYSSAWAPLGALALAIDSARLTFGALDDYVGAHGALPTTLAQRIAVVRNYTLLNGYTSSRLSVPNGIRPTPTPMVVYNAGPNGAVSVVANITSEQNISWAPSLYLMGRTYALADVPPAIDPPKPAVTTPPYWIIGLVFGVLLVLAIPGVHHIRQGMLLAVRPTDSAKPFAVMFVGVKNISDVQDAGPENAAAALGRVMTEVRRAVRKHDCYEARRVDESTVMIVAKEAADALHCAASISSALDAVHWSSVMNHAASAAASPLARPRDGSSDGTRSASTRRSRHTQRQSIRVSNHDSDGQSTTARTKKSLATATSSGPGGAPPSVNIGLHFGFGVIDLDEALNTVSYVGAVVTRAAIVADAAGRDQIVVSREVREIVDELHGASSCGLFAEVDGWHTVAPDTFVFIPHGSDEKRTDDQLARMRKQVAAVAKGGVEATGTIAAALQRAEAGMAQKRIGVVVVRVPFLEEAVNDSKMISRATDVLEDIAEIASWNRGEVHSIQTDRVTILVNASVPAAQPVTKAALIALGVVDALRGQGLASTAGVSGGLALIGNCIPTAGTAALGRPAAHALAAEEFAAKYGLSVCVYDNNNSVADLASRLHVVTVGAAQLQATTARFVAAIAERDATGGEWLYAMTAGNAALAANEVAWNSVLELKRRPDADVLTALRNVGDQQDIDEPTQNALAVSVAQLQQVTARLE